MLTEFGSSNNSALVDLTFLIVAACGFIIPLFVYFCSLIFSIDPLYYILDDIQDPPTIRSTFSSCSCFGIRVVSLFPGFEAGRILSCGLMVVLLILLVIQQCGNLLKQPKIKVSLEQIIVWYKRFSLQFVTLQPLVQDFVSLIINVLFWDCVLLYWIAIKAKDQIPQYMYYMLTFSAIMITLFLGVMLTLVSVLSETSNLIIQFWQAKARKIYVQAKVTGRKCVQEKINYFEMKGLWPIRIWYAPFLKINRWFSMSVLDYVIDRLVVLLLMF